MKVLYVATVRSHIGQFHVNFLNELKEGALKFMRLTRIIPLISRD